ncbi:hypothetical protein QF037_000224 [Streptomyces canus]|uniref:hypothetical protein n=1 Tax=Streptomyces canus TaxID=58343 RepID=UPI00278B64F1|nr:hypothetical protein [Streptomyces canus]MDQ0595879.1 hypothetical protein [Streptomyces canus]
MLAFLPPLPQIRVEARGPAGRSAPYTLLPTGSACVLGHGAAVQAELAGYRKILAIVRAADGPVQVRAVGKRLSLNASARGKLEPLRAKMTKLADRSRLHKGGDGRFTARP